jgi:glucose-1-phosphate thymidylyltransferase
MKGVLICGGSGTRLKPLTEITNKSLLAVYHKPLILFPLQVLLDADIKHIAIVSSSEHVDQMAGFLGSGNRFGCEFSYRVQDEPKGIAQALGLAENFVGDDDICAILGDNIYFDNLVPAIQNFKGGAHLFLKDVHDPERFGVATLENNIVTDIVEKPEHPKSKFAVTGCYVYDKRCFDVIRTMKPSARGELEITDVSNWYVQKKEATATVLQKEWIDAGTFESLFQASSLVRDQQRKNIEEKAKTANIASQTKKVPHVVA